MIGVPGRSNEHGSRPRSPLLLQDPVVGRVRWARQGHWACRTVAPVPPTGPGGMPDPRSVPAGKGPEHGPLHPGRDPHGARACRVSPRVPPGMPARRADRHVGRRAHAPRPRSAHRQRAGPRGRALSGATRGASRQGRRPSPRHSGRRQGRGPPMIAARVPWSGMLSGHVGRHSTVLGMPHGLGRCTRGGGRGAREPSPRPRRQPRDGTPRPSRRGCGGPPRPRPSRASA